MDDDNDDWLSGAADEEPAPEPAKEAAPATGGEKAAAEGGADGGGGEGEGAGPTEEEPEYEEGEYLDPDKLLLFKHWIRPKFLPYKYLTEYRLNYYNDVIDFLDKRNRGIKRDIPVAQTWAERVLRTYASKLDRIECYKRKLEESKLVEETKKSGLFQLHHGRNYIHKRYYSVLY